MSENRINELCAITESSNKDFPKTRLALTTFITHNTWFNGKVIVLTLKSNPISNHNINILGQIYSDIEIREVDDIISDNLKITDDDRLDYLRAYAFNIKSEGNIYFSRNCIFLSDVSECLNSDHISSYEIGNSNPRHILFDFDKLDSSFMFIPYDYLTHDKVDVTFHTNINDSINEYILSHNFKIAKDLIILQSILYPDNKYSEFIRYHKNTKVLYMNTYGLKNYTRIALYWVSLNKKYSTLSPSRVKIKPEVKVIPKINVDESKFNISVIIPAYKAEAYIEECINSIVMQSTNAKLEILIGIDNCESTLNKLKIVKNRFPNLRVFYSDVSVGPYVLRNSLIEYAKYDNLLFFDADDIMKASMISTILSYYSENKPIRFKYLNFNDSRGINVNTPWRDVAHGVFFSSKSTIDKLGGFMPWKCGADTEFMKRCSVNNILDIRINEYVFYRRIHSNSLTQHSSTNHRSQIRDYAKNYIKTNKDWSIPIKKEITNLIEI